jgi:hypothetical protein
MNYQDIRKIQRKDISILFRMILLRPTYAYYGLCIVIGKLVEYTLMAPLYITIVLPRSILFAWIITSRQQERRSSDK